VTDVTVYPSTNYIMDEMVANGLLSLLYEPLTEKAVQSMKIAIQGSMQTASGEVTWEDKII
jgi:hypothetical protein